MSNTAAALPVRPKIGRPSLPPLPLQEKQRETLIEKEFEAEDKELGGRWEIWALALVVVLVLFITLVTDKLIAPVVKANLAPPPPIPPLVERVNQPGLSGLLAPVAQADPAVPYVPERKPAIDNEDRQRLRSILSKD